MVVESGGFTEGTEKLDESTMEEREDDSSEAEEAMETQGKPTQEKKVSAWQEHTHIEMFGLWLNDEYQRVLLYHETQL